MGDREIKTENKEIESQLVRKKGRKDRRKQCIELSMVAQICYQSGPQVAKTGNSESKASKATVSPYI